MLSRVAENLFWIGRYMERAENVARLVDAARRMSTLPQEVGQAPSNEWASVLIAAGGREAFGEDVKNASQRDALAYLLFDKANPSSVMSCLTTVRENARSIRFALTQEIWEAVNSAWSEGRRYDMRNARGAGLADLIDWVKSQSALMRGAVTGTMLRDDGFNFLRLGASFERADCTARLLDVKYHVLLPSLDDIGSGADNHQWVSLLQATAAQRAYAFMTKSDVSSSGVARFLIMESRFPRSILFNLNSVARTQTSLETYYGQKADCHDEVSMFIKSVAERSIEDIFKYGLHEFLTDFIDQNYEVANLLAGAYGFAPVAGETDGWASDGSQ
ncbi:MAG: alpha-E domain-containing protein [Pseudomonadota bacterium]